MSFQSESHHPSMETATYPWILEHLLAYPGSYEIPLRTMYTLNSATQGQASQSQALPSPTLPPPMAGNAFPSTQQQQDPQTAATTTAAAQLRANLMSHISQSSSQPASLPPAFVTGFVMKCFPRELGQVDFPHALTALDYLKDLEVRRRREVVAALDRLGVDRADLGEKQVLGKKYPGVLKWITEIESQERKVEALYTQVYLGLRRWTLINEMSLRPYNKSNCIAMLNTVYPPTTIQSSQFIPPTHQLTAQILHTQRDGFFRYISAVEKHGSSMLKRLIEQGKRENEDNGWPSVHETIEKYLQTAKGVMAECAEITGTESLPSPVASSFASSEVEDEKRRKVDSGISFAGTSNRGSLQSNQTRPSTSSSRTTHSRNTSAEKPLPPYPQEAMKPAGSTLERIAREIRKIRSRGDIKDAAKQQRPVTADISMADNGSSPPTPTKEKKIRLRPSLKKMRSTSALRERDTNSPSSTPSSRQGSVAGDEEASVFNVEEMRRKIMVWEAKEKRKNKTSEHSLTMEL